MKTVIEKRVATATTIKCPECGKRTHENDWGSTMHKNGVAHMSCPVCYKTHRVINTTKKHHKLMGLSKRLNK